MNNLHTPISARIVSVLGYNGLPHRYLVQSRFGWLGKDSFGSVERAYVFASQSKAKSHFLNLFPTSMIASA